jgi:HK97 family phage prohead protease
MNGTMRRPKHIHIDPLFEIKDAAVAPPAPRTSVEPKLSLENKATRVHFEVKAVDPVARTFEGMASTWDQDLGGDVITKGAYKRTINNWKKSKRNLPLIDSHNYYTVRAVLGKLLEAEETDDGLWVKFEVIGGADGDEVLERLKGGYIDGMSIGYSAVKVRYPQTEEERTAGVWRYLDEVKLREVSLVIFGMNEGALIDTSSVKTLVQTLSTSGEPLSEEDRLELKALYESIGSLLTKSPDPAEADPVTEPAEPVVTDEVGLEPDDPKRIALAEALLNLELSSLGTVN